MHEKVIRHILIKTGKCKPKEGLEKFTTGMHNCGIISDNRVHIFGVPQVEPDALLSFTRPCPFKVSKEK